MAERIVSPGVFTREKDLSFLPQGIAEIGAAIVGPTLKGPAFVPTTINTFQEFEEMFGGLDPNLYVPHTVKEYLRSAGTVTIVRVLGLGGYSVGAMNIQAEQSGSAAQTKQVLAVLAPNKNNPTSNLAGSTVVGTFQAFDVKSGINSFQVSASFQSNHATLPFIKDVFSDNPLVTSAQGKTDNPFYLYKFFGTSVANDAMASGSVDSEIVTLDFVSGSGYSNACTPAITSQKQNGLATNLFSVKLRSHGESNTNKYYKIGILNVKAAGSVAGSDYGTFSLQVRKMDQVSFKETDDEILEQFDGLNLDSESENFVARRIGDRYVTINDDGKLNYNGDWPNMSKHIYISDYEDVRKGAVAKSLVPYGHAAVKYPTSGSATIYMPSASFTTAQVNPNTSVFDPTIFYGFNFQAEDNRQYLCPLGDGAFATFNPTFSLDDMKGNASATANDFAGSSTFSDGTEAVSLTLSNIAQRKFVVPFQGGNDGANPAVEKKVGADIVGSNQQGFDCSTATASGSVAYKRAINAVSNQDEFDINLLVTPGIIHSVHSSVTLHGISVAEGRGDCFFIFDPSLWGDTIFTTTQAVRTLDTNYAASYYPWVKLMDTLETYQHGYQLQ